VVARLLSADASLPSASPQQLPSSYKDTAEVECSNPFVVGAPRTPRDATGSHRNDSMSEAQQVSAEAPRGAQGCKEEVQASKAEPQGSAGIEKTSRDKPWASVGDPANTQATEQSEGVPHVPAHVHVLELTRSPDTVLAEAPVEALQAPETAASLSSGVKKEAGVGRVADTTGKLSQLSLAAEPLYLSTAEVTTEEAPLLSSLAAQEPPQVRETPGMVEAGEEAGRRRQVLPCHPHWHCFPLPQTRSTGQAAGPRGGRRGREGRERLRCPRSQRTLCRSF